MYLLIHVTFIPLYKVMVLIGILHHATQDMSPGTNKTQELPCHNGPGPHMFKVYSS